MLRAKGIEYSRTTFQRALRVAIILIVGLAPVLRELIGDLSSLTDHAATLAEDWHAVPTAGATRQADVVMLDACLPGPERDEWTRRAADLNAVVIYYADSMSDGELQRFASTRNAPCFALPNGPRRFAAVVREALARREAQRPQPGREDIPEMSAHSHARLKLLTLQVLERARATLDGLAEHRRRSRELRDERDAIAAEMRLRREALRDAVVRMAKTMRTAGTPPERALAVMRDALRSAPLADGTPEETSRLLDVADHWVLAAYAVA